MPPSPDDDPIKSAAQGITEGTLSWAKAEISAWVKKFLHREVAFIQDEDTISLALKQYRSQERELYTKYITDKNFQFLAIMGMTLRQVENNQVKLQNLRDKIHSKYSAQGLRIAQAVENELLLTLIGILIPRIKVVVDLQKILDDLLKSVDKYVVFIKHTDDVDEKTTVLKTRLDVSVPPVFVFCGAGTAMNKAMEIRRNLERQVTGYSFFENRANTRVAIMLVSKELIELISD